MREARKLYGAFGNNENRDTMKFPLNIPCLISAWKSFHAVETAPRNAVEIRSRACQPGRCDREKRDRFRSNDNHRYISIRLEGYKAPALSPRSVVLDYILRIHL